MLADPLSKLAGSGLCGSSGKSGRDQNNPKQATLFPFLPVRRPSSTSLIYSSRLLSFPAIVPTVLLSKFIFFCDRLLRAKLQPISSVLHHLVYLSLYLAAAARQTAKSILRSVRRPIARSKLLFPPLAPPQKGPRNHQTKSQNPPAVLPSARCNLPTWLPPLPRPLAQLLTLWP